MLQSIEKFARRIRAKQKLQSAKSAEGRQISVEFTLDEARFRKYGTPKDSLYLTVKNEAEVQTQLDRDIHRVEKGLALRKPKRPFGVDLLKRLDFLRTRSQLRLDSDLNEVDRAIADLGRWNDEGEISDLSAPPFFKYEVPESFDLSEFFWRRKSVRVFKPQAVAESLIETAVDLARNSPSVCNRQSWRVYAINSEPLLSEVLPLQNGNESFRSEIPVALVITSDLQKFSGAGERNQVWVDGGLFAMSLAWALHGLGLGTCMLNWSVLNSQSELLRSKINISDSEEIITLMAVGHPEENIRYARSEKKSVSDILFWPKA